VGGRYECVTRVWEKRRNRCISVQKWVEIGAGFGGVGISGGERGRVA
jgi:hypothetical protein